MRPCFLIPAHDQRRPRLELDPFLAMRLADPEHAVVKVGRGLDQHPDPAEGFPGGLEFVRRPDQQLLIEEVQAAKRPRLKDAAFPVLPGHDDGDLERGPVAVRLFPERDLEGEPLPGVQDQARGLGQLNCLWPRRGHRRGNVKDAWPLLTEQLAGWC
jgi:hypothetical protein